jgi:hypothetical protein
MSTMSFIRSHRPVSTRTAQVISAQAKASLDGFDKLTTSFFISYHFPKSGTTFSEACGQTAAIV